MTASRAEAHAASFRDPSGFIFESGGVLYRQVNAPYAEDYRALIDSGLLEELWDVRALIPHIEAPLERRLTAEAIAVLEPKRVPTLSYPYEWCFGQLKDAALLTLDVQKRALARGMSLKDGTAYNILFLAGRPILIDTLSFERYPEGKPWIAYRQFCSHFLAPLALMAYVDVRLQALLRSYLDGIPLDLASELLPGKTKLHPGLGMHIHMHAKAQSGGASGSVAKKAHVSKTGLLGLIDSLEGTIRKLEWTPDKTTWANYYQETNYSDGAFREKQAIVSELLDGIGSGGGTCWDLGANTGEFSRLAVERGFDTVAFDFDPAAVEKAYRFVRQANEPRLLPLLQDITNPSPGLGWASREREGLLERGPVDVVLALALVHHLAIGNNVPLDRVADLFAKLGRWVIVEWVGKQDSQVVRMLSSREDVFSDYRVGVFESAFGERFEQIAKRPLDKMDRTLYLFRRR